MHLWLDNFTAVNFDLFSREFLLVNKMSRKYLTNSKPQHYWGRKRPFIKAVKILCLRFNIVSCTLFPGWNLSIDGWSKSFLTTVAMEEQNSETGSWAVSLLTSNSPVNSGSSLKTILKSCKSPPNAGFRLACRSPLCRFAALPRDHRLLFQSCSSQRQRRFGFITERHRSQVA